MKRIHLLYLILLAICISFGSCKDEEEEMTNGTGGILTGVWGLVDDDGLYVGDDDLQYGLRVSIDGKMQRVRFSSTVCEPFNDYADGIIQQVYRSAIKVLGIDGEFFVPFALDTIIRGEGNRLVPFMRLHLATNQTDGSVDYDSKEDSATELDKAPFPVSGIYIKALKFYNEVDRLLYGMDGRLLGEWEQQFGTNSFAFFSGNGKINVNLFSDWRVKNGVLYILKDGVISQYPYSFDGTALVIGEETFIKVSK